VYLLLWQRVTRVLTVTGKHWHTVNKYQ
jgi:hypothetical protein